MEPTDPPRAPAPSLLSGTPGKSDQAKNDSGRILASLEKGPAAADTARIRTAPAAAVPGGPKLLPLLGAGIAVGVVIWFLSGHIKPPGTATPAPVASTPPADAELRSAESPAPATAIIVSTTPSQPPGSAGQASAAPVPPAAAPAAAVSSPTSHSRPEALASIEPAGQPQRSPLAVLTDDDTDAQKAKKPAHAHKKTDSDVRLIEALVSHVNGDTPDDGLPPKKSMTRTTRSAGSPDGAD